MTAVVANNERSLESVLVIDDSSVQRAHGARLCREMGIATVHEASNGSEALALLEALDPAPALLIIDLEMPTMDGPELLAQLRQRRIDIPIVVASSRERALIQSVSHMGSVLGLRILDTVQKPLTGNALAAAVAKWDSRTPAAPREPPQALPIDVDALHAALDRKELRVHFQPQVEIKTGLVRGVEALVRWQHPTLGLVTPDRFIPLAEQSGLVHELTLQVLNQTLLQAVTWSAESLDLRVAVNISPLLLDRAELVHEIASLQSSYGIASERIILEVTESSLLRDPGVALGVLTRLRLKGFGLSLDDYGTGFSSMQQLAQIPFTELKIDRSFIRGVHERDSQRVILRSAVEMASELGLVTVGEGVETREELGVLEDCGCTLVQGWLFAKAMPAAQLTQWLRSR
ncbi:MAG: EAL domain-containing response regulator [Proteobacteria bacterium]|nr:EAL domain-containing response regulator [Pseudomonadota bacterium]